MQKNVKFSLLTSLGATISITVSWVYFSSQLAAFVRGLLTSSETIKAAGRFPGTRTHKSYRLPTPL